VQPDSVKQKGKRVLYRTTKVVILEALVRAVRPHQVLQFGVLLDLEVNNVAVLQLSNNKRVITLGVVEKILLTSCAQGCL
jgi:hypothetical protein